VLYLRTRERRYDIVAGAAAEVGVLFCALGIGMGMLWAKPVWGAFWIPGDIHLLATAVLFLIYVAYLMIRGAIDDDERRARLSAVVGTFAIIAVPIVFFSIRVIQVGNHPVLTGLTPRMQFTFMFCMTVMMLFFTFILLRRVRLEFARAAVEDLRRDVLDLSERATTGAGRPAVGRVVAGAAPAANPVSLGAPGAAFSANAVETRPRP